MKLSYDEMIYINDVKISINSPTYFIADIAANHDGDLNRAVDLIYLAADAGANAAKFQHFQADTIVSDFGFKNLKGQLSHQKSWKKSVYEVYKDASVSLEWTSRLAEACNKANIAFFSTPYSLNAIDSLDPFMPAYKIGSGDITWHELVIKVAQKNKPYLIATGASSCDEVYRAVTVSLLHNRKIVLMQCNTNYTAEVENFKYINLNVLKTYHAMYPGMILGLSDHTLGHSTVLGAVALGARVVEKHFTDDIKRQGPDHAFSMSPSSWREMVDRTRELENALGSGIKKVEVNELETVVLQRRGLCAIKELSEGHLIKADDLIALRPCPAGALHPYEISQLIGRRLAKKIAAGQHIEKSDVIGA